MMVISGQTVVGCDGNSTATNEYYNYYTTAASAGIPYWFYKLFAFDVTTTVLVEVQQIWDAYTFWQKLP